MSDSNFTASGILLNEFFKTKHNVRAREHEGIPVCNAPNPGK